MTDQHTPIEPADDDAEFEAFLQGRGTLAGDLAQLEQPVSSAALDAAILERVAGDLVGGVDAANDADPAANDPHLAPYPRSWQERWRMPLALAAGVTAISIALPLWQDDLAHKETAPAAGVVMEAAMPPPAQDAIRQSAPASMVASPPAAPPPASMADRRQKKDAASDAAESKAAGMVLERSRTAAGQPVFAPPPAPVMAAPPAPPPAPAAIAAGATSTTTFPAAPAAAPPAPAAKPVAPRAPMATPAPAHEEARKAELRDMARPPASSAGSLAKGMQAEDPDHWLARITQLLHDGRRDEALQAWGQFQENYPDYPVPPALQSAINAAKNPAEEKP